MRIIFAGTPEFARLALAQLHGVGHDIALVLTQPDRPAGRGMKLQPSAVKQFALEHQLPLAQPRSLRLDGKYPQDAAAAQAAIAAAQADVMVVAAYGLILPQWVLDAMRCTGLKLGCLNIHASLLPRWRGAAPIHRAIEAGDAHTGITVMQMDAGLDTGDMLLRQSMAIEPQDTTGSLHDKLAQLGGELIVQALAIYPDLVPVQQPDTGVSYAAKLEKLEGHIDWSQPAAVIERRIRAFNPYPGAVAQLAGESTKVWAAQVLPLPRPDPAKPGQILAVGRFGIDICATDFVVRLTQLQRAGGKSLPVGVFLRGFAVAAGDHLA